MPEIKNLKKAANRILKAIKNKEKIIIYGDADLDGTASVVILEEAIENLEGNIAAVYPHTKRGHSAFGTKTDEVSPRYGVEVYFVDRENEGYGINKNALAFLKHLSPALLIALDLGITNFEEVKIAKKLGLETIIIDHHQVIDSLPDASIIVDPKQKDDNYPFKEFAAAGLVYELTKVMLKDKMSNSLDNSFLELAALATIADMMVREEDNKTYIEKGLQSLKDTQRIGLKVFFEINSLNSPAGGLKEKEKVQKIVSALNVSEIKDHLTEAYLLLTCQNKGKAKNLVEKLLDRNEARRSQIKDIVEQVEERILDNSDSVIFEGDIGWPNVLIGSVASRVCNKHKKPTFIFKKRKENSMGAVRVPSNMDAVKAMKSCQKLLMTFGGHAPAAGFTVKNENLEKFKKCLIKYFKNV
ncbi:DHH family phosphoesterase [Candidatus Parcubacteria bacterium]|nr:DHH family phosphoesterase [Candidatus Parcubacteria bacterium]